MTAFSYIFKNYTSDTNFFCHNINFEQYFSITVNQLITYLCTGNVTGQKSRAKVGHPFANLKGKGKKGSQSWFWVPRKLAALEMTTTFPFAFNLHQINLKSLLNSIRTKPLVNPIPST